MFQEPLRNHELVIFPVVKFDHRLFVHNEIRIAKPKNTIKRLSDRSLCIKAFNQKSNAGISFGIFIDHLKPLFQCVNIQNET